MNDVAEVRLGENPNFFEIFGLPVGYRINDADLLENYLKEQMRVHPDVVDSEANSETEKSSHLNIAYNVLSNPMERAGYFLKLCGKDSDTFATEFAVEMFSIREKYATAENQEERKQLLDNLEERKDYLIATLYQLENNLDEFQKNYSMLRFIDSFCNSNSNDEI
jgi:molecular chaperone HscB